MLDLLPSLILPKDRPDILGYLELASHASFWALSFTGKGQTMSFGTGIGDVISISTLAWKVFKSCKDSSEDFRNLSNEVVSLHVVLKETQELILENDLDSEQASHLGHLKDGCQKVLEDLQSLLERYKSLGMKSQRTWDRMKWGTEGIANVRTRLISNTTMLSAYNTTMVKYVPPPDIKKCSPPLMLTLV